MSNKPTLEQLSPETDWPPETLTWFNAWRDSERTDAWDAVQWQFMLDTACVHALVYASGQMSYLGELRSRLMVMGLEFEKPKPKPEKREETPLERIGKQHAKGPAKRKARG